MEEEISQCVESHIIYKSMISDELRKDILDYYDRKKNNLEFVKGSHKFPLRRQIRELPDELTTQLTNQLNTTMSQYYTYFNTNSNNVRIYESNYGIILPHKDIPSYANDTHTCLIYLTDNFNGGVLSIKQPRSEEHIDKYGESDKKHITVTPEPRICYGVIFPKNNIHYPLNA